MIPRHKVDEILQATLIEEVIGEFVNLKKSGRQYKALSPFTNEKTPSFYVVPEKQIFKDFSSGKGGNAVTFLMEVEHFSYPEALRWLAQKYNIELEEQELTPEQKEAENERESLYIVSQFAEQYFKEQLHETDAGKSIGLSYFKQRGFLPETIEKFKLGYSPDEWRAFTDAAFEQGYQEKFLTATGLTKPSPKRQNEFYDGFKGRVIFPIHSLSGRAIGFGGRTLIKDKKVPKYLNSPESLIYNKSASLYGIYFAKGEIIKEDQCYLVEGYTDVISFHQAGISNTVASSGTALTRDQIKLIKRYTPNITLLYDGDEAGIKASFRGIDMILEEGMNVKMVSFPEGEDPDSFALKNTPEDIRSYLADNARDFIVSKTEILLRDSGKDPIKRASVIKDIVASIALIPEAISRSVYTRECANLLEIEEKVLVNELNKLRRDQFKQKNRQSPQQSHQGPPPDFPPPDFFEPPSGPPQEGAPQQQAPIKKDHNLSQERDLMRILINYGEKTIIFKDGENGDVEVEIAPFIFHELERDEMFFEDSAHLKLSNELVKQVEEGIWDVQKMVHSEDKEIASLMVDLMTQRHELHDWDSRQILVMGEETKLKRAVEGALYSFKFVKINNLIRENQEAIKQAYENNQLEEALNYQKKQVIYDKIKSSLAAPSGRIILG
ncbi:DNA primase [bacterium SCSIO 12741]|nr:DNA primase [bacterium SCSIO 12741]